MELNFENAGKLIRSFERAFDNFAHHADELANAAEASVVEWGYSPGTRDSGFVRYLPIDPFYESFDTSTLPWRKRQLLWVSDKEKCPRPGPHGFDAQGRMVIYRPVTTPM